eukprot:COSAG06_NODE_4367_length_4308_cov_3.246689_4_plen_168_part_00
MCSHRSAQPNGSTIGGLPAERSEWLHLEGDRNCEADSFRTPGKICADVDCQPPVRPRGGVQCDGDERASSASVATATNDSNAIDSSRPPAAVRCKWWASDVVADSVQLLRDFNLTAMPRPTALPDTVRGVRQNGTTEIVPRRSFAQGGEIIALHAVGYGVLDVTVVY